MHETGSAEEGWKATHTHTHTFAATQAFRSLVRAVHPLLNRPVSFHTVAHAHVSLCSKDPSLFCGPHSVFLRTSAFADTVPLSLATAGSYTSPGGTGLVVLTPFRFSHLRLPLLHAGP